MNKPSLYAQYLAERSNVNIIEKDTGYITYIFTKDYCYIEDIYVVPEARGTKLASNLAKEVAEEALKHGYKKLLGSVCISANGAERNVAYMLNYGYKIKSLEGDMIYFIKDI